MISHLATLLNSNNCKQGPVEEIPPYSGRVVLVRDVALDLGMDAVGASLLVYYDTGELYV